MAATGDVEIVDMTSTSPQSSLPSTPMAKRKAEEQGPTDSGRDKKTKTSLVELKPRKVVFTQEAYQRHVPRRRLLKFEGWLLDAEDEGTKPTAIPDEFFDVLAMAGHELTSSSETNFIKSLKSELVKGSNDFLTNELLATAVGKLFSLKQYGFIPSDFGVAPSKLPAGMQIRCWEANDLSHFPADRVPDLIARREERERAREECVRLLAGLNDDEKAALLKGEKIAPKAVAAKPASVTIDDQEDVKMVTPHSSPAKAAPSTLRKSREGTATSEASRRSVSPSWKGKKLSPEEEEAAKKRKEEKEAKRIEREEKKKEREERQAAKERELQKKAEVKAKQAQMFGAFFGKPKEPAPAKPAIVTSNSDNSPGPSTSKATLKEKESDFHRMFRPPPQRANVEWAPINRWQSSLREASQTNDLSTGTPRDFIDDHLRRFRYTRRNPRANKPPGLKTAPAFGTVADKWLAYQESEDPRSVLRELRDTNKFPWKTLSFDQQPRPPYCGTFTKRSVVVGARTPFAQDPIFDYSYDSEDDWQEDEGGDDVDGFAEVAEEPELQSDEEEGEFDDWLDDEDDILMADEPAVIDMTSSRSNSPKPVKKLRPVKKVTPKVPTCVGPVWEEQLGTTTDGLDEYRIQLLNDTPNSFNPFEYISSEQTQLLKPVYTTMAIGLQSGVRTLESVDHGKPPPKPEPPMPLGDASSSANQVTEKKRPQPKVAFPATHLPELLKIVDGNTKIFSDLTSTLRERFDKVTTKIAIEAKIREVATREGKAKDSPWRVKAEAWSEAGINPPPRAVTSLASNGA